MAIFDLFRKKGWIEGMVIINGLPSHKFYSVSVTFFQVGSASVPPPFNGDPPAEQYIDTAPVKEAKEPDEKPLEFRTQRNEGFYYLAVGVIAYIERNGKMFAQVERFFPMSQPCQILPGAEQRVELNVIWPDIPFDKLGNYGTVHPSSGKASNT